MKLLIKKLWLKHDVDKIVKCLFKIPKLKEQFDKGYEYVGEMRPRGLKIFPNFWPADDILERLPQSEKDVYLILTTLDLKGDYGRIHGKGLSRKAIASNDAFIGGINKNRFNYDDPHFLGMVFGEIGHSLGLSHHEHNQDNPCEMSQTITQMQIGDP